MTPKEKAEELVGKFRIYIAMWSGGTEISNQNVKQCALIAVDEILDKRSFLISIPLADIKFWQEVKQEIEKL